MSARERASRNRGKIATRGRGGGISAGGHVGSSQGASAVVDTSDDQNACGLCTLEIDNEALGCDDCPLWFHPSPQCMGISQASIDAIIREGDGGGLKYVCTECTEFAKKSW